MENKFTVRLSERLPSLEISGFYEETFEIQQPPSSWKINCHRYHTNFPPYVWIDIFLTACFECCAEIAVTVTFFPCSADIKNDKKKHIFCPSERKQKIGKFLTPGAYEKIELEFELVKQVETPADLQATKEFTLSRVEDLLADFRALFKEGIGTDMAIECESTVLNVHKTILSARSTVFRAMLSTPMKESASSKVIIEDMGLDALKAMVQFMYCGQVTIESESMADGLLHGAEKYQISSLKEGVLKYLISVLSPDNALELLQIADLHDEPSKKQVLEYIRDNFDKMKRTEEWKKFKLNKPQLALEIYSMLTDS